MRQIIKNITLPIDGTLMDFRLKKLDAFSGASLMRLLAKAPSGVISTKAEGRAEKSPPPGAPSSGVILKPKAEESPPPDPFSDFFLSLSPDDLRSLMTSCLNHAEVLLPAGYIPVMTGEDWSWPEAEHDTVTCLKLTMEVALWTLQGFFAEGGPTSRPAAANTP